MWSGGVIDIHDGCDFVNVVFQYMHLKRIIAGLEMSGLFKELHQNVKFFLLQVQFEPLGVFLFMRRAFES